MAAAHALSMRVCGHSTSPSSLPAVCTSALTKNRHAPDRKRAHEGPPFSGKNTPHARRSPCHRKDAGEVCNNAAARWPQATEAIFPAP